MWETFLCPRVGYLNHYTTGFSDGTNGQGFRKDRLVLEVISSMLSKCHPIHPTPPAHRPHPSLSQLKHPHPRPKELQQPRHRSACVEATVRQLHMCERSSCPWLNRHLMSTEVAENECNISISTIKHCRHTWNYEVVKGHVGKAWIHLALLIPPPSQIFYIFRV